MGLLPKSSTRRVKRPGWDDKKGGEGLSGRRVRGPSGLPSPRLARDPPYPGHSPVPASPYSSSRGAAPQRHVQALPTPSRPHRERPPPSGLLSPHTDNGPGRVASLVRAGSVTSSFRDESNPGPAFRLQNHGGGLARAEARVRTHREGGSGARPLAVLVLTTVRNAEVPAGLRPRDPDPVSALASFDGAVTARGGRP